MQEMECPAAGELGAPLLPGAKQVLPHTAELSLQGSDELQRVGGQHSFVVVHDQTRQLESHRRCHVDLMLPPGP